MDNPIEIRRILHQYPEISDEEYQTTALIEKILDHATISHKRISKTGTIGFIPANADKTLLLRADIDALPICEQGNHAFKSKNEGVMHACGHDVHTAILLGAAQRLKENSHKLRYNIKLMFQPAEEGDGGALPMINAGVLDNPKVDLALAFHVWDGLAYNQVKLKKGPLMAAPDFFDIVLLGKDGHGAKPEQCINPVSMSVDFINHALGECHKLREDYKEQQDGQPFVLTFTAIECPSNPNTITNKSIIRGTARAFDNSIRQSLYQILEDASKKIQKDYSSKVILDFRFLFPPLVNDSHVVDMFRYCAVRILGEENVLTQVLPDMTGEDFSYIAERVPAALIKLGGAKTPLHTDNFDVDERCIHTGIQLLYDFACS